MGSNQKYRKRPHPTTQRAQAGDLGAGLTHRCVVFVRQSDFENLNFLPVLKGQEMSHKYLDFWLLVITRRYGIRGPA